MARLREQRLCLVGGGPGGVLSLRHHFKEALAALGEAPLVAYVGVASNDHLGFQKMLTTALAVTGARFRAVHIASPRASIAEARDLLDEADLLLLSGGDVEQGMVHLRERDVLPHLRALCLSGKPMFGISAGSVMLGREWVRFPDDDDAKAEIFECIGAAPFSVDAHSEDDDWSELRTLLTLQKRRGDAEPIGYGLTAKGALSVVVAEGALSVEARGTDIPRIVVHDGVAGYGEPLRLGPARGASGARPTARKR